MFIADVPQCETKFEMDHLLTYAEIALAIKQINIGRASGLDDLPVELLSVKMFSMLDLISSQSAGMDLLYQMFGLMVF